MRAILLLVSAASCFAQSTWSPASLPGCVIWMRADDVHGVANGGTVNSPWANGCGTGSFTPVNSPALTVGAMKGHNFLVFNGSNQYLTLNWSGLPYTMYAVIRSRNYNSHEGVLGEDTSNNSVPAAAYYYKIGSPGGSFMVGSLDGLDASVSAQATPALAGGQGWYGNAALLTGFHLYGITFGYSGTTASVSMSYDGEPGFATSSGTINTLLPPSGNTVVAGSYYSRAVTDFCNCDIAEVIAFSSTLNSDQIGQLETYFERKYFGPDPGSRYIWYGFPNNSQSELSAQVSNDGVNFTEVPITSRHTDAERDPSVVWSADNQQWWVAHSGPGMQMNEPTNNRTCGAEPCFALEVSKFGGLFHYAFDVGCSTEDGGACWAPEFFTDGDGSVHVITAHALKDGSGFVMTETHPTTKDWLSWSTPINLNVTNWASFSSGEMIDPFIFRVGNTYHMLLGGGGAGIFHATATSLTGNWTVLENLAGTPYEGSFAFALPDNHWRIYIDGSPGGLGTYKYIDCTITAATTTFGGSCTSPTNVNTAAYPGGGYLDHGTMYQVQSRGAASAQ